MKKIALNLLFGIFSVFTTQLMSQNFTENLTQSFNQLLENNQLQANDLHWIVTGNETSSVSNLQHVYFTQVLNGIEIYGTESSIHILPNGKTLSINNKFLKDSANKTSGSATPSITAVQAITSVANKLNYQITSSFNIAEPKDDASKKTIFTNGGISLSNIPTKLVYHITSKKELILAWDISIEEISGQDWWSIRVDATTGTILDKNNWMLSCSFEHDHDTHEILNYNKNLYDIPNYIKASEEAGVCNTCYEVTAMPLESPYFGARSIESGIEDASASPFGWHDTNGVAGAEFTVTRGNNVNANTKMQP